VRRALEDAGLPAARLSVTGWGEARPVADNESADGRARNRRVEIIVD
jgi:outer membrane protein OmpA-like peptidoglycan-associated protein